MIQSVVRALNILETIRSKGTDEGMGLVEIAKVLGLEKSTTYVVNHLILRCETELDSALIPKIRRSSLIAILLVRFRGSEQRSARCLARRCAKLRRRPSKGHWTARTVLPLSDVAPGFDGGAKGRSAGGSG